MNSGSNLSIASEKAAGAPSPTLGFLASLREQVTRIPVAMFGIATAIGGLSVAWRQMHLRYGMPLWISEALAWTALAVLFALGIAYVAKAIIKPSAVVDDFKNPVLSSLFALIPLALLSIPSSLAPEAPVLAEVLWLLGMVSMIACVYVMTVYWLAGLQLAAVAAPAWIVTACGVLNVPLALPALHLEGFNGISVFAFGVGIMYFVSIYPLILSRLLFQAPLQVAMRPALMILTAPFSIGYSAYVTLSGQNDLFAQSMFMMDLFLTAVIFLLLRHLAQSCPFRTSWWSVGFPLAATTNAALRYAAEVNQPAADAIALFFVGITTAILLWLFCRTLFGILAGELKTIVT